MKILYLVHQFYPDAYQGTEKFVLQLAQCSQAAGHEVKVITYGGAPNRADSTRHSGMLEQPQVQPVQREARRSFVKNFKARLGFIFRQIGIHPTHLRARLDRLPNRILHTEYQYQGVAVLCFRHYRRPVYLHQQLADPSLTAFAREIIQREKPDLIHAGHTRHLTEFLYTAHQLQIPYLLTLTDFWMLCWQCTLLNERNQLCGGPRSGNECRVACPNTFPPMSVDRRRILAQRLLTYAESVVAPSHFLASKIQSECGPLPITIIPYGIDVKSFTPNPRHYPTNEPLSFLFAGGLFKNKGIHLLLEAFRRLTTPAIRLQIYGSGALMAEVQQAVQADKRIIYGGLYQSEQLNGLLSGVDVVVIPSIWHENLPLIMQEAQAAGVPTLVADVGGMTECITDGVNGFTFRMGDVADLQQKIQMIIDQPAILNAIKENIRNPKPGQYRVMSLEEEAALYRKEYARILAKAKQVMG